MKGREMDKANRWKGGKVKQHGYWCIKQKDGSYSREHILKIEKKIGRKLYKDECVHHKNGNRADNRLNNLQLMTKSEHHKHHFKEMLIDKKSGKIIRRL